MILLYDFLSWAEAPKVRMQSLTGRMPTVCKHQLGEITRGSRVGVPWWERKSR